MSFSDKLDVRTRTRMFPSPRINLLARRRNGLYGQAQNRIEPAHRVKAAIETENVLIKIGLQVLDFNAPMMRTKHPRLQVRENFVNHGKVLLRVRGVAVHHHRVVLISQAR